jgi:hypothetical protein
MFCSGSAPAPGAADDALVVGLCAKDNQFFMIVSRAKRSARGAPNSSRGGCAPQNFYF